MSVETYKSLEEFVYDLDFELPPEEWDRALLDFHNQQELQIAYEEADRDNPILQSFYYRNFISYTHGHGRLRKEPVTVEFIKSKGDGQIFYSNLDMQDDELDRRVIDVLGEEYLNGENPTEWIFSYFRTYHR